jgi:Sigma-70 region 2
MRKVTVDGHDWLADGFEVHRSHLRAVAYRMLGSASEADDAVQEAGLRLFRADVSGVQNLGGSGRLAESRVRYSASPSPAARSSPSTSSPTPAGSASST